MPIGHDIVDFAALELKPVGEIDGVQHVAREADDTDRTRISQEWGYHVVRFWKNDVLGNTEGVLEATLQELQLVR